MSTNQTTPTTTRSHVDALFSRLVATEQILIRTLARDGEALGWVIPFLQEEAASGRLGQWLPAVQAGHHQAFLDALEGAAIEGGAASAQAILQATQQLRITRDALLRLASGPCSGSVHRAVDACLEASNQVTTANQGLAQRCANRVLRGGGASAEEGLMVEAVGAGMVAIMSSVDRFQPLLGNAFSTFSIRGVEAAVRDTRAEWHGNVHLSEGGRRKLKAILAAESRLLQRNQSVPSTREVAEELGLDAFEVEQVLKASGIEVRLDLDEQDEAEGRGAYTGPEVTEWSEAQGIEEVRAAELRRAIRAGLATLSERQAQILTLRFGLEDGEGLSRPAVARELGISPARVRSLEDEGLRRLRPFLLAFHEEQESRQEEAASAEDARLDLEGGTYLA